MWVAPASRAVYALAIAKKSSKRREKRLFLCTYPCRYHYADGLQCHSRQPPEEFLPSRRLVEDWHNQRYQRYRHDSHRSCQLFDRWTVDQQDLNEMNPLRRSGLQFPWIWRIRWLQWQSWWCTPYPFHGRIHGGKKMCQWRHQHHPHLEEILINVTERRGVKTDQSQQQYEHHPCYNECE